MGSGLNWDMVKTMIQERFSECGSSIIARNKLTSLTQKTIAMHEYISEFSTLMEHTHGIKPTDPKSKFLASNFIDGIQNPYIKNKLRMQDSANLSALYVLLLKKIRNKRSENLILAVVLHKSQHNVISMQLKAVDVSNVAVMTISSRTALLVETVTKNTVVLAMANTNTTMIIDQNQMMRILLRNQFKL